jgi:tRNA(Ile)-lysidine synthase
MKSSDLPRIVRDRLLALGVEHGDLCLVALSGGQDSTALMLAMLSGWGGEGLTAAAHLDHAGREGSEREQAEVKKLCDRLGVEIRTGRLDPGEVSRTAIRTGSLEAAMRICRYRFLMSSAGSMGAKWLLTGHTADDQVETVLFRVLRKMDPMALSGIPERRSTIIRPLLGIGRDSTSAFCMEMGIKPLLDPSNRDFRFARNRIRYHTIPALKSTFHPHLDAHILRLSSIVGRLTAAEEGILERRGEPVFDEENGTLLIQRCRNLPVLLRESAVGRFLHSETGIRPSRSQIREAMDHLFGRKRGRMSLPGGKILDSDGKRTYIYDFNQIGQASLPYEPVKLTVPGRVEFKNAGVVITAEYGALGKTVLLPAGNTVFIGRKGLRGPLWVRRRHPGDRFKPLGMEKTKKLKDFFIDRKIPQRERETVPLVLDNRGDILWVAGVEISSKAALEGYSGEETVVLRMEKVRN